MEREILRGNLQSTWLAIRWIAECVTFLFASFRPLAQHGLSRPRRTSDSNVGFLNSYLFQQTQQHRAENLCRKRGLHEYYCSCHQHKLFIASCWCFCLCAVLVVVFVVRHSAGFSVPWRACLFLCLRAFFQRWKPRALLFSLTLLVVVFIAFLSSYILIPSSLLTISTKFL